MSEPTTAGTETTTQQRGLTLWPATALVTGTMIGAGIFTLPSTLAKYGPISLIGFALTALGAMTLALVFASLARRNPDVGGPYAFARRGFGDFIGFQSAWSYWIGAWAGVAAISVSFVGYLGQVVTPVADNSLLGVFAGVFAIAFFTWVNSHGVSDGGLMSLVLTILKVVPLLGIGTLGFLAFDADNLGPFNATAGPPVEVVSVVMALTLFSFIGVEAATIPAGDVHEPDKTIPRATTIGTMLAALVYLTSTAAVFGAVPNGQLQESSAPFAVAAGNMFGSWAGDAMAIVAMISCLGAMNGLILLSAQVPMAAEFDGLAPRLFGRLNTKHVPVYGLLISSGLAILFTVPGLASGDKGLVDTFTEILLVSTTTTLVAYAFSAGAEMRYLLLDRHKVPVKRFARQVAIAVLAMAYAIFMFYGAGLSYVGWVFIILMAGVPLYILILWGRQRQGLDRGGQVKHMDTTGRQWGVNPPVPPDDSDDSPAQSSSGVETSGRES